MTDISREAVERHIERFGPEKPVPDGYLPSLNHDTRDLLRALRDALDEAHRAGWDAAIEAAALECEDWQAFTRYTKERISGEMADAMRALPYKPQEDMSDG